MPGSDIFHQQGMQAANHQHNNPSLLIHAPAGPEFYNTNQSQLESSSLNITQAPNQMQTELSSDHALPPYDLLYALVDLYFKHINTCKYFQKENSSYPKFHCLLIML
jgi:hypothetical protein